VKKRLGLVFFVFATVSPGFAQGLAAHDEAQLRAIPQQIVDAWSGGDGTAIAAVYAEAGTLVAGDGTMKRGRAQIASYHDRQFAEFLKGTRLSIKVTEVRLLRPNVAYLQTQGGILWPGQTELAPGNYGIQSFIALNENGVWRLELFQNTRVLASTHRAGD
jgi:uncharacterized protein (TIGR02246 family)